MRKINLIILLYNGNDIFDGDGKKILLNPFLIAELFRPLLEFEQLEVRR